MRIEIANGVVAAVILALAWWNRDAVAPIEDVRRAEEQTGRV